MSNTKYPASIRPLTSEEALLEAEDAMKSWFKHACSNFIS